MKVQESPEGLAEIGRWLDERRAERLSCGRYPEAGGAHRRFSA